MLSWRVGRPWRAGRTRSATGVGLAPDSSRPLAELLPWLALHGDQRVLCKDGSLLACFDFAGADADSLDAQTANHLAERAEQAFRSLDERFTLWSTFERRRSRDYPVGEFPNPLAARIDRLHGRRFRQGDQFVNRHVLSLLFSARSRRGWTTWLSGFDRDHHVDQLWSGLEQDARTFEALVEAFTTTLDGLGLRRLAGDELLGFLNGCASPTRAPGPVRPPGPALFLDAALGEDRLAVGIEELRFSGSQGRRRVAALGVKAWPDATVPGLIESLLRVPAQVTVSQVFRFISGEVAKAQIQSVRRFHLNLQRSAFSFVREAVFGEAGQVVDDTRSIAAAEARAALEALASQRQTYGHFNLSVMIAAAPDEDLDAAIRACAVAVREAGFLVLREGMHLLSAWSGSLPGQWVQLVRWHLIHTGNLADLVPLQSPGPGGRHNRHLSEQLGSPCTALSCLPGIDHTTFHFNFHQGDLGHCLVAGPSRSGKSILMNFLLTQFLRYPGARVVIFDKDRSCRIPTLLQGGCWLDPAQPGGLRCNPLLELGRPGGQRWLHAWLQELLTLRGRAWESADDGHLHAALDALRLLPPDQHRLATLRALLPRALAAELAPWVDCGPHAALFDHSEDTLALQTITCIEMGEILRDDALARLFMSHAVRRIDGLLAQVPLAPTVIYIEEAWFMLAHPLFRERIRDWLKTLPKRLALVVMATQSLDDLADSGVFSAIADNVPTRLFLANPNAGLQAALYQGQFGLNPAQLQRVARAEPKRQFLVVNPSQSRFIDLLLPAETVNLLRSDRRAQEVFDRCRSAAPGLPPEQLTQAYLQALDDPATGAVPAPGAPAGGH